MNVIITEEYGIIFPWSNLKKVCEAFGWSYSTVSKKKFPIIYKGIKVSRDKVR